MVVGCTQFNTKMKKTEKPIPERTELSADAKEKDLLVRIASKQDDALEAIYRLYFDRLFRFAFRITGRMDCIEEIINDVMLVVWNKANTYDHCCRPSTWIFGIAYNKSRKYQTLRKNSVKEIEFDEQGGEDYTRCNSRWVKQIELRDQLDKAFGVLSPEQRLVIELTYYHGMHYSEIAKIAGCPENTVKTRMFHARQKLSRALQN